MPRRRRQYDHLLRIQCPRLAIYLVTIDWPRRPSISPIHYISNLNLMFNPNVNLIEHARLINGLIRNNICVYPKLVYREDWPQSLDNNANILVGYSSHFRMEGPLKTPEHNKSRRLKLKIKRFLLPLGTLSWYFFPSHLDSTERQ